MYGHTTIQGAIQRKSCMDFNHTKKFLYGPYNSLPNSGHDIGFIRFSVKVFIFWYAGWIYLSNAVPSWPDMTLYWPFLAKFDLKWPLTGHVTDIFRFSIKFANFWYAGWIYLITAAQSWSEMTLFWPFLSKFDLRWPLTGHVTGEFRFSIKFAIFWYPYYRVVLIRKKR